MSGDIRGDNGYVVAWMPGIIEVAIGLLKAVGACPFPDKIL